MAMLVSERMKLPLVVDLDGTLTPTDTLVESVIRVIKRAPFDIFRLPLWLLGGRARFKEVVASRAGVYVQRLPYRQRLLDYLREERSSGRKIILATAAHKSIADRVAAHLGLFDAVIATEDGHNLKGPEKLRAIRESVGPDFAYAGDSRADVPIWSASKAAILVGLRPARAAALRRRFAVEKEFPGETAGISVWLRAIRVHQWLKNLLLFVPLLTSFSFLELDRFGSVMLGFIAFSLAASSTYVLNDLWDLENDRVHASKRERPFASGRLSVASGLVLAAALLVPAVLLAVGVSYEFLLMLITYLVMTTAYSWVLKEYVLIDVLSLALLYTLRILAGSVATGVTTSSWLLAFSVFLFLSLALVKRCAELVSLGRDGHAESRGRDYRVTDLVVLWPLGIGAALSAVVVFGLFISSEDTRIRYGTPELLWLVAIGFVYWLGRVWIKTSRGEMHDDPVVYAIRDRGSRVVVFLMGIVTLIAHALS